MRNSTNYSLLLPEENDSYSVNDVNANTEFIDAQMKKLENEAAKGTKAASDLQTHIANKSNPHGVTKEQVGLGNVPNVSTNNQTPTYAIPSSLSAMSSGEVLSTAFGKLAKAVSELISHIANSISHITSEERTAWNAKLDRRGDMMSGKLKCNDVVEIYGTNNSAKGLKIMRDTSEAECVTMRVEDGAFGINYVNDEGTSQIVFTLQNNNTEESGSSNAGQPNTSTVVFGGTIGGSSITANEFRGLASSATKLQIPRTISLSGDVSGSVSFDGTANAVITTTVADDSHNHVMSNVDGLQTKFQSVDKDISDLQTLTNKLEDSLADGVLKFGWSSGTKELVVIINGTTVGSIKFGAAG